jgi:hypothetical protein
MALHIYLLIEATALNGLAVDAVLHARATKRAPTKSFCVVFRDKRPLDEYPIPLLWIKGCVKWSNWIGHLVKGDNTTTDEVKNGKEKAQEIYRRVQG